MSIISYQGLINFRRASAAEWASTNPILANGEIGVEIDTDLFKTGNGADAWNSRTYSGMKTMQPYDMTVFYPGKPPAGVIVTRVSVARGLTFPLGLVGSVATARLGATALSTFDVQKNGASVATIRFAAGAASATFIAAAAIVLAAGDTITILAPAAVDATLADVSLVLSGTR